MRKKSYYTAKEVTNNLYTNGKEWQLPDGTEYKGLYHTYTTGEIYTGAKWDEKTSSVLIPFTIEPPDKKLYKTLNTILTKYQSIATNQPILVTNEDRNRGFFYRYFIRKNNETNISEIDASQYDLYFSGKIDPNLYTVIKVTWYITGNIQDEVSSGATKPGVITKNAAEVKTADRRLNGISSKLTNLTEYYTDTDFVVPKDINK